MGTKSMDVFSLRDAVVGEYRKFARSFTTIHAEDIRRQVEAIYDEERYWPEPLIQINPSFRRTTSVDQLVAEELLEPECADIFRSQPTAAAPRGEPLKLFKHQEQAVALAAPVRRGPKLARRGRSAARHRPGRRTPRLPPLAPGQRVLRRRRVALHRTRCAPHQKVEACWA